MKRERQVLDKRIPKSPQLIEPTLKALQELGGSGNNDEILNRIIIDLNIADDVADIPHRGNPSKTELAYQADWARTYLRIAGIIENSSRSVWAIKTHYDDAASIDAKEVMSIVRGKKTSDLGKKDSVTIINDPRNDYTTYPDENKPWVEKLSAILQSMDPFGFERLAQRVLRECGFTQVEVTKKTGDGGIDGTGKLRINGIFSFNVAFQCKRYKGQVGAAEIRDFRGSLTTDIEKGVLITTGTFSKAAKEEAANPGKQQIDLIDGEDLISKIIEFGIGVKPITVYEVDEDYFKSI